MEPSSAGGREPGPLDAHAVGAPQRRFERLYGVESDGAERRHASRPL
jgi:hypothetical protein